MRAMRTPLFHGSFGVLFLLAITVPISAMVSMADDGQRLREAEILAFVSPESISDVALSAELRYQIATCRVDHLVHARGEHRWDVEIPIVDGKVLSARLPIVWSMARLDSADAAMDRHPLVIDGQYLVALRWSRDVSAFVPFVWNSSFPNFATVEDAKTWWKKLRTESYPDGEPGHLTHIDDLPRLKAELKQDVERLGAALRSFIAANREHLVGWFRMGPANTRQTPDFYPWHDLPRQGSSILYAVLTAKQPERLPAEDAQRVLRYSPNMAWEDRGIVFEKSPLLGETFPARALEDGIVVRMAQADGLECGRIVEWHQTITTEVGDFNVQVVFSAESAPPEMVNLEGFGIKTERQRW